YAKEGGRKLKYIYDTYSTKIVITGSSASALSIQSMKFLVGRLFVFNLYPFSFDEYLSYKDPRLYELYRKRSLASLTKPVIERILPHFNEFCTFGGYPRAVLAGDKEEKETVLKGIYNTYFLREIKEILNLPEDYKLSKLISALALQIGNIINYNELSDISAFRHKELLGYMNVLEKTFVTVRGLPFYTNKRTELVKSPKIFFLDNGLRNFVVKNFQSIEKRQDKGALYENFVASELLKKGIDVRFWRTKSKAEVDFVMEKKSSIIPVEVKSDLKKPKFSKSFLSFIEKYKPKKGFVLSEKIFKGTRRVKFMPIFLIGKEA
ncbi:ATP-binding protein, partial [Candidatus Woesearchaeota archaeon]|nr:ATP-binding protein [Candidatus Woesearchaeota archaeon]